MSSRSSAAGLTLLAISLTATLLCAVVAGAAPAIRLARVDVVSVLQQSPGGSRSRLRGGLTLLTVESALAVVLVLGALLVLRSFTRLSSESIGFDPKGLYLVAVTPRVKLTPEASLANYQQILEALRDVPGVMRAAGSDSPAGGPYAAMRPFSDDRTYPGGRYEVTAGYFDVLLTPIVAGREFAESEVHRHAPVCILSVSGARAVWPDASPYEAVGLILSLNGEPARHVVGIVADLRRGYGSETSPALYVPLGAAPRFYGAALVRADAAPRFDTVR